MGWSGKAFHKFKEGRHVHQTSGACVWLEGDMVAPTWDSGIERRDRGVRLQARKSWSSQKAEGTGDVLAKSYGGTILPSPSSLTYYSTSALPCIFGPPLLENPHIFSPLPWENSHSSQSLALCVSSISLLGNQGSVFLSFLAPWCEMKCFFHSYQDLFALI